MRHLIPIALAALALVACKPGAPKAEAEAAPADAAEDAPITLNKAKNLYARTCASCHGPTGRGNGPRARSLVQKPTDFTDPAWQRGIEDPAIVARIQVGGGSMPAYQHRLSDSEIERLVEVLRGFGANDEEASK